MNIVDRAINFVAIAHAGQSRKGTNTPYITHPFAVGMYLQRIKCTEEVIAAGILHDTIEDTSVTFELLLEQFGRRVAELVLAASEKDKSLSWFERKQLTIDQLSNADLEEIQVITADKLHNIKSIRADLQSHGDHIWDRFNRGEDGQRWYYRSIVKVLLPRKNECELIEELEREVLEVFGVI